MFYAWSISPEWELEQKPEHMATFDIQRHLPVSQHAIYVYQIVNEGVRIFRYL